MKHQAIEADHLLLGSLLVDPELLDLSPDRLRGAITNAKRVGKIDSPVPMAFSKSARTAIDTTSLHIAATLGHTGAVTPAHLIAAALWEDAAAGELLRSLGIDPDAARTRAMKLAVEVPLDAHTGDTGNAPLLSEAMNRHSGRAPVTEEMLVFTCLRCGHDVAAIDATIARSSEEVVYSCPRDGATFVSIHEDGYHFIDASMAVQIEGSTLDWWHFVTAE